MNTLKIQGNWNVIKGKLKQQFSSLKDDDLMYAEGREDELLGRLQRALGKTRDEVITLVNGAAGFMATGTGKTDRTATPDNFGKKATDDDAVTDDADEDSEESEKQREPAEKQH